MVANSQVDAMGNDFDLLIVTSCITCELGDVGTSKGRRGLGKQGVSRSSKAGSRPSRLYCTVPEEAGVNAPCRIPYTNLLAAVVRCLAADRALLHTKNLKALFLLHTWR